MNESVNRCTEYTLTTGLKIKPKRERKRRKE